jgi:hypothetical protein
MFADEPPASEKKKKPKRGLLASSSEDEDEGIGVFASKKKGRESHFSSLLEEERAKKRQPGEDLLDRKPLLRRNVEEDEKSAFRPIAPRRSKVEVQRNSCSSCTYCHLAALFT